MLINESPVNSEVPISTFDEVIERRDSNSMKWAYAQQRLSKDEVECDPLPMWVADTDFRSPQPVLDALHKAVDHGVFGYPGGASDSYLNVLIHWQKKRFDWDVKKE